MNLLHKTLGTVALVVLFNASAPLPASAQQACPSDAAIPVCPSGAAIPVFADDFVTLANIAMADGDYHNAAYHANKALDIDPELAEAYLVRGQALSQLGQREAAIADLERAADLYLEQNDRVGHQAAVDSLSGV